MIFAKEIDTIFFVECNTLPLFPRAQRLTLLKPAGLQLTWLLCLPFVVMPNHIHGIVRINVEEGDPPVAPTLVNGPRPRSLESFIAGYKSFVTRCIAHAQHGVGATGRSPFAGTRQSV